MDHPSRSSRCTVFCKNRLQGKRQRRYYYPHIAVLFHQQRYCHTSLLKYLSSHHPFANSFRKTLKYSSCPLLKARSTAPLPRGLGCLIVPCSFKWIIAKRFFGPFQWILIVRIPFKYIGLENVNSSIEAPVSLNDWKLDFIFSTITLAPSISALSTLRFIFCLPNLRSSSYNKLSMPLTETLPMSNTHYF